MKNETRRDESCHTLERRERLAPSRQEGILGGTMTSATPSTCPRCDEPLPESGEDCPTCQTEAQAETLEVEGPSASTADLPRAAAGPTGPAEAPTLLEGKTRRERARLRLQGCEDIFFSVQTQKHERKTGCRRKPEETCCIF